MTTSRFDGFVHARDAQLVDGQGHPLLLRGMGLGNWLLPEGYMWRFGDEMSSPRQIEARIRSLVGAERAEEFWRRFGEAFLTELDIARIAELGYDHVRLPLNSRSLIDDDGRMLEAGFARIDDLIGWCRSHGIWVLLDLHGAPGGQTGTNIDDSPRGLPELFMEERYRMLTIRLWEELARRYRHETVVLGYDLLNEPLPNDWQYTYAGELAELYRALTIAIREIDPDHLIVYEGAHWATNWSIFTEVWDANSMLQFHRYWCAPDESSIDEYLAARDRLGLPIYMGEGGENTPEWIYTAHRLYERHGIGWNFWPWKKLDTRTSPLSIRRPAGWDLISDPGATPGPNEAWAILEVFLAALPVDQCDARSDIVNAMFARAPLSLPAWGHDPQTPPSTRGLAGIAAPTMWHHTAGEPYTAEEVLPLQMAVDAEVRFALEKRPEEWTLDSDTPDDFVGRWADGHLVIRALRPAVLRGVKVSA
ncbi:glycoside hydrolase family 5 protein [Microbacterium sp. cx-59]|uniref:glycoside hydrolase family 5 protein n=1 Tax=Microbacterium sp. cx-59 TaxID=2891207 RepID=UPI001E34D9A8|nr:cellulase family glycosylhydrolase [Microbacterium sp. cx-59]MCC4909431.1 glycoside hydrolase family 5 protein [Microbacterium sp. cx-59]